MTASPSANGGYYGSTARPAQGYDYPDQYNDGQQHHTGGTPEHEANEASIMRDDRNNAGEYVHSTSPGVTFFVVESLSRNQFLACYVIWLLVLVGCTSVLFNNNSMDVYSFCNTADKVMQWDTTGSNVPNSPCVQAPFDVWESKGRNMPAELGNPLRMYSRLSVRIEANGLVLMPEVVRSSLALTFLDKDGETISKLSSFQMEQAGQDWFVIALPDDYSQPPATTHRIRLSFSSAPFHIANASASLIPIIVYSARNVYYAQFEVGFRFVVFALLMFVLVAFVNGIMRSNRRGGFSFLGNEDENFRDTIGQVRAAEAGGGGDLSDSSSAPCSPTVMMKSPHRNDEQRREERELAESNGEEQQQQQQQPSGGGGGAGMMELEDNEHQLLVKHVGRSKRARRQHCSVGDGDGLHLLSHGQTTSYTHFFSRDVWKALSTEQVLVMALLVSNMVHANPLYIVFSRYPKSGFWQYYSMHLTYNIHMSVFAFFCIYVMVSMPFVARLEGKTFKRLVGGLSFIFVFAMWAIDVTAYSLNANPMEIVMRPAAIFRLSSSSQEGNALSFALLVMTYGFCCFVVFWRYRRRMAWKKGAALYCGYSMRIRMLWVRIVASILAFFMLYWIALYWPVLSISSRFMPLYLLADIPQISAHSMLSVLCAVLLYPKSKSELDYPPNPFQYQIDWSARQWSLQHLQTLVKKRLSGFFFFTEDEKRNFDASLLSCIMPANGWQQDVRRSFFCLETAFTCLNLSNEVYNSASDVLLLHHNPACIERCCCCFPNCCAPSSQVDPDDLDFGKAETSQPRFQNEDERENEGEEAGGNKSSKKKKKKKEKEKTMLPEMNFTQFGFQLVKCVSVFGIQATVCIKRQSPVEQQQDSPSSDNQGRPRPSDATVPKECVQIAVVFRGTANASNALTDVNIVRKVWDEMVPNASNRKAKVHGGFLNAWIAFRYVLGEQIQESLAQAMAPSSPSTSSSSCPSSPESSSPRAAAAAATAPLLPSDVPIYVTGHSLGGALASLCSYSLSVGYLASICKGHPVYCYTYGQPRVGNESFVREYDLRCPETYRLVNENDRVTTIDICARRHVGRTVIIDRDGNMLVEPNTIERWFCLLDGAGNSIKNHLLDRYASSMDAALLVQCEVQKSFRHHTAVAERFASFAAVTATQRHRNAIANDLGDV